MTVDAFTFNLETDIGKLRLVIGDTDSSEGAGVKPDGTNLTDQELQVFLDQAASWQDAVPEVLRQLARLYSLEARRVTLQEYSEDLTSIAKYLTEQAKEWENRHGAWAGLLSYGGSESQPAPFLFGVRQLGARIVDLRASD